MAGEVALSQALSFARDLKSLYETSRARERDLSETNMRLRAAHRQTLRYASDLKRMHRRAEQGALHSLLALANALEARHAFTRGHSARVSAWARRLALAAGLPVAAAELIAQAGLLHDLGKISVSESIVSSPAPLSAEEQAILREHPLTGARILAPLEFFAEGVLIVRHHHERIDGSGYPAGLKGDAIPIGARIVAVADVYDALTSARPYRPALAPIQACERLRDEAGQGLDAALTALFLELVGDGWSDGSAGGAVRR